MIYTVSWTDQALQKLADIWLNSNNRSAITVASYELDQLLRDDPDLLGKRRYDTVREFRSSPLGIEFEVIEADRVVHVLSVWHSE